MRLEPISEKFAKDTWEARNKCPWFFMPSDAPVPATLKSEEDYYRVMANAGNCAMYAIVEDGMMIGSVKLRKNGELSFYILRPEYEGRGLAKQAIEKVLDTAFSISFNTYDMVFAWVNTNDAASYCLLAKLGFKAVGASLIHPNVHRLEITRSQWKTKK